MTAKLGVVSWAGLILLDFAVYAWKIGRIVPDFAVSSWKDLAYGARFCHKDMILLSIPAAYWSICLSH